MPLSSTLAALRDIIQVSFHWQDYHLYEFVVGDRVYGVPSDEDEFYNRKIYKAAIRLKTLVERGVGRFLYGYDFGDDWRHDVIVEEVHDGDADTEYPAFVDGARRCPPEDVDERQIRGVLRMFAARRRCPLAIHRSGNRGGSRKR